MNVGLATSGAHHRCEASRDRIYNMSLLLFPNILMTPVINKMQTQFGSVLDVQLNS